MKTSVAFFGAAVVAALLVAGSSGVEAAKKRTSSSSSSRNRNDDPSPCLDSVLSTVFWPTAPGVVLTNPIFTLTACQFFEESICSNPQLVAGGPGESFVTCSCVVGNQTAVDALNNITGSVSVAWVNGEEPLCNANCDVPLNTGAFPVEIANSYTYDASDTGECEVRLSTTLLQPGDEFLFTAGASSMTASSSLALLAVLLAAFVALF